MILTATLVADGGSDRVLLPLIAFLLDEHCPTPHRVEFAAGQHAGALSARIARAINLFPCDLLFIHRDAEAAGVAAREDEIRQATAVPEGRPRSIRIIPVRMTESWLLVEENAIRRAAGNPNGQQPLALPPIERLEALPDPKEVLLRALMDAKGLGARRSTKFRPESLRHRVSELMEDFSRLRALDSFRHFEKQVVEYFSTSG